MRHRGHRIAPLPDAYSRVTDAERFRPLHDLALALVGRLRDGFQVEAREEFDLVRGLMQPFPHARPPVTLTPVSGDAAPLAIAFTPFPSLVVRCGRRFGTAFPVCGCDACAATADAEGMRLEQLVGDVVSGQFAERLEIPLFGAARLRWWLGDVAVGDGHRGEGSTRLSRSHARALRAGRSTDVRWQPWPPRRGRSVGDARAV